jgi:hypothetical protein
MHTTIDHLPEVAEQATPDRLPRCRRLVTVKHQGRSTGTHLGPPARQQCTAEIADPTGSSKLCVGHLADAMTDLVAAGAVVVLADLPAEMREEVERWTLARRIVEERIESGELIRRVDGTLIEADAAKVHLARTTAEHIVTYLIPTNRIAWGREDMPTTVEGVAAHLLSGRVWISWMDDRVLAAMRQLHGEPTDELTRGLLGSAEPEVIR